MIHKVQKFLKDESGATAIEYGLIAAFISISVVSGATQIGTSLSTIFNEVGEGFPE